VFISMTNMAMVSIASPVGAISNSGINTQRDPELVSQVLRSRLLATAPLLALTVRADRRTSATPPQLPDATEAENERTASRTTCHMPMPGAKTNVAAKTLSPS
jgi:hypothetical protein